MGIVGARSRALRTRRSCAGAGVRGRRLVPAQLHMRVVRSPSRTGASSRSTRTRRGRRPGVVAVWTGADLADLSPIDFRDDRVEKLVPYRQPVLARGRVRYVGEPVAVVFADDPYRAEDAADLVTVEIEELPPVLSTDDAPGEFEPGSRPSRRSSSKATATSTRAFRCRPCRRRARPRDRTPHRRAAGDARRHRALRFRPRRSGTARRRQGAAPQPRAAREESSTGRSPPCICSRAMSAAASACAASFIRRMCWSASRRCGSAAR